MPENVSFTEQNDVQHFALFLDSITKTSSVFSFLTLSTGGRVLIQEYYICRVIKHSFFFFFFLTRYLAEEEEFHVLLKN